MYIVERWHHYFTSVKNVCISWGFRPSAIGRKAFFKSWRQRNLVSSKRLFSSRHSVTSMKTWIFRNIAERTTNLSSSWQETGNTLRWFHVFFFIQKYEMKRKISVFLGYTSKPPTAWNGLDRVSCTFLLSHQVLVPLFSQVAIAAIREISFVFSMTGN